MLTGDKLETAENIGFSSKLFDEQMSIFRIQSVKESDMHERLTKINEKITEIQERDNKPIVGTQYIFNPNAGLHQAND